MVTMVYSIVALKQKLRVEVARRPLNYNYTLCHQQLIFFKYNLGGITYNLFKTNCKLTLINSKIMEINICGMFERDLTL